MGPEHLAEQMSLLLVPMETDVATAEEETCGEARAPGDLVETADTHGEAAVVDPET